MISSHNYSNLDWNTPISTLLPSDFVLSDPWATAHITLEDALSHRTGLPRHDKASHRILDNNRTATIGDIVRLLRHLPLNAGPRTTWQYCNHMFVVATHVVQTLTGRGLGDVLREWVWAPLEMTRTFFDVEEALSAAPPGTEGGFAKGYFWEEEDDDDGGGFREAPFMTVEEVGGAGAVVSSVEDYVRWAAMWVRGGEWSVLSEEAMGWMKTPRIMISPGDVLGEKKTFDFPMSYALGWEVASYKGHTFWTHAGGMHAYGAEVYFFPSLDFGFVSFGNSPGASNAVGEMLAMEMVEERLGVPKEERPDWGAGYVNISLCWGISICWKKDNALLTTMHHSFRNLEQKIDTKFAQAIQAYYPSQPDPPLPQTLALTAYEGTYFNPGYLNFTLLQHNKRLEEPLVRPNASLVALRTDATWPLISEFEHVSGEYWMMYSHYPGAPHAGPMREYAPVEFRIGSDGMVKEMGITWLQVSTTAAEDTVEGKVWFKKIA